MGNNLENDPKTSVKWESPFYVCLLHPLKALSITISEISWPRHASYRLHPFISIRKKTTPTFHIDIPTIYLDKTGASLISVSNNI